MITSILSTVGGGLVGLIQNVFEKKQETKRYKIEKELENESQRISDNTKIELAKTNIDVEKYKSICKLNEVNKAKSEQEKQEYSDFTNTAIKLNKIDKGWGRFMRPMYSIGFFVLFVFQCIYFAFVKPNNENLSFILHFTAYTIDYIIGYWFVRRGREKFEFGNYFGSSVKKKFIL